VFDELHRRRRLHVEGVVAGDGGFEKVGRKDDGRDEDDRPEEAKHFVVMVRADDEAYAVNARLARELLEGTLADAVVVVFQASGKRRFSTASTRGSGILRMECENVRFGVKIVHDFRTSSD